MGEVLGAFCHRSTTSGEIGLASVSVSILRTMFVILVNFKLMRKIIGLIKCTCIFLVVSDQNTILSIICFHESLIHHSITIQFNGRRQIFYHSEFRKNFSNFILLSDQPWRDLTNTWHSTVSTVPLKLDIWMKYYYSTHNIFYCITKRFITFLGT